MADVSVFVSRVRTVDVRPYLDSEVGPFVVVELMEENVRLQIGPEDLDRARAIAGSIIAACNAIEGHKGRVQHRLADVVVPIASLAPDLPAA